MRMGREPNPAARDPQPSSSCGNLRYWKDIMLNSLMTFRAGRVRRIRHFGHPANVKTSERGRLRSRAQPRSWRARPHTAQPGRNAELLLLYWLDVTEWGPRDAD